MSSVENIKQQKFENVGQMYQWLKDHNYIFIIDPKTKNDLYVKDTSKVRNDTLHYTLQGEDGNLWLHEEDE